MIYPAATPMTDASAAQVHQLVAAHLALVARVQSLADAARRGAPRATLAAALTETAALAASERVQS